MNLNAFFRSAKFRVLLCLLALLTGIMLYSLKSGAHTDYLTRMMQSISAPARKASSAISGNVSEHLDTYFESKAYRDENARLRREIASLNEQLIGYDDAIEELNALRDQLGIKQKHRDYVLSEPCKVLMPVANDLTHRAAEIAIQLCEGGNPEFDGTFDNGARDVPCAFCAPVIVTEDNYRDILIDSGYYSEEDLEG